MQKLWKPVLYFGSSSHLLQTDGRLSITPNPFIYSFIQYGVTIKKPKLTVTSIAKAIRTPGNSSLSNLPLNVPIHLLLEFDRALPHNICMQPVRAEEWKSECTCHWKWNQVIGNPSCRRRIGRLSSGGGGHGKIASKRY